MKECYIQLYFQIITGLPTGLVAKIFIVKEAYQSAAVSPGDNSNLEVVGPNLGCQWTCKKLSILIKLDQIFSQIVMFLPLPPFSEKAHVISQSKPAQVVARGACKKK